MPYIYIYLHVSTISTHIYVMYLLQVEDEAVFPSKIGGTFPRNFLSIAKLILKRLFRVYAHVYHQHFKEVNSQASAIVST